MYNHFECLDSSLSLIMCIIFKGHREEEDVEDEGVLDPSQELIKEAELLMIGDNEKARLFRWFKFTLRSKPPYTIAHGNLLSAIWDTSHWTSFVKFGLKTA